MSSFLSGAIMMGAAAAGLFFVKSWDRTGDRLLLLFGMGFWILAIERWILAAVPTSHELRPLVYLLRLTAFVLILAGIIEKNRSPRS